MEKELQLLLDQNFTEGRGTEDECVGRYYAGECLNIPDYIIKPYFDYGAYGNILIESESITMVLLKTMLTQLSYIKTNSHKGVKDQEEIPF